MGLFSWFRKKNKTTTGENLPVQEFIDVTLEEKPMAPKTMAEASMYLRELGEQRTEVKRQIHEAEVEYEAVTSYLTDTQRIEMVPLEESKTMHTAAEKIVLFRKERDRYKTQEIKLSERHRQNLERYDGDIPDEIKKMQENERYQAIVKNDLRHLEGEKGALLYEREDIIQKQDNLKKLAITCAVLVVILLALLVALSYVFETSMQIPFLLTVIMGVASAFYILWESRNNRAAMALNERKIAKAIGLLNKVKIKYVNTTSCLEYEYEKLGVESSMELEYVWKQYCLVKEREKKLRLTTEKIGQYNDILIGELKKYGVADAEVWIYQPEAIIDRKEMVEVRHRLNTRRQKLRERLEYNQELLSYNAAELEKLKKEWRELEDEIRFLTDKA